MKSNIFYFIFLIFILSNCSRNRQNQSQKLHDIEKIEEKYVEINREIVKLKQDTIKSFIEKNNWEMKNTGSGLWYHITPSGISDSIEIGDIVQISYTVSLLNGKLCYTSDSIGPKTFKVGQGGVESGLEEALLLMHKGDSARLLIPPHLAYGLIGDQNQIPRLAILNYTVIVRNHKKKE